MGGKERGRLRSSIVLSAFAAQMIGKQMNGTSAKEPYVVTQ